MPTTIKKTRFGGRAPSPRRGIFAQGMPTGLAAVLAAGLAAAGTASAEDCTSPSPGAPIFITDDCTDPDITGPFIDVDEMRTDPVPHRFVHGGFTGTDTKFSIAFPPAEQYQGRFFQGPTHQLNDEDLSDNTIAFTLASGAYAVASNQGGSDHCTTTECAVFSGLDPSIGGYRANAAAAKYSRELAAEMYGPHRPYGYIYGGSGGAYQTVSSLENTSVYDGGVPFVLGHENSIPTSYTLRINAQRIIGPSGKFPCIDDAYDAGGSGDPASSCDLSEEVAEALEEATRGGFPTRGWFGSALTGAGALPLIAGYPKYLDPTYTDDFWTLPGYLGHDDPYGSLTPLRFQDPVNARTVLAVAPPFLILDSVPAGDLAGWDLVVDSGAAHGQSWAILFVAGTAVFPFGADLSQFAFGDKVHIDNSAFLALQTYHRHQVGTPEDNYYAYDQFRDPMEPGGTPVYPQRAVLTGPIGQFNGSGGHMTGVFHGKMILQESMMDVDAYPWGADWYKRRVEAVLGNKLNDKFRIYFQDYAQHGGGGGSSTRTVSYQGALQQDLRDLAAWAERGVKPPRSTRYEIENFGQVVLPSGAGQRKGMQPVVTLWANGGVRAEVSVGEPVTLTGKVKVPPGAGKVVSVEWNVEGATGAYEPTEFGDIRPSVEVETTHVYSQPGTYFPVLRGTSQREGDPETPFARIQNIGRARVVVSE